MPGKNSLHLRQLVEAARGKARLPAGTAELNVSNSSFACWGHEPV